MLLIITYFLFYDTILPVCVGSVERNSLAFGGDVRNKTLVVEESIVCIDNEGFSHLRIDSKPQKLV